MSTFQEYDCPGSHDFDLEDEQIAMVGQRFVCSGCSKGWHTPEEVGLTQTAIPLPPDQRDPSMGRYFEWRGLPRSIEEKAAWIAEGRRNQALLDAVEKTEPRS